MIRITMNRLRAMEEALLSRLAGPRDNENDPETPSTEDYEEALDLVQQQIEARL